jgi:diaminohydroxyphosphoribosylaminopyrimidine deaminase/5-amino-6-(5-phosphoribosylamino)uracil reductase
MTEDEKWMEIACREAEKAFGRTSPNPLVGAVAVKNGKLISAGYHQKAGEAHAEVNCLPKEQDFRGATVYVTLEPCSSHGRTPPCTERLISAGVSRVVIGTLDPNPAHAGKAVTILQAQGIDVTWDILPQRCWQLNLPFFKWIQTGKPFVTLKMAMTLDGKIATKNGCSQWITGPEARAEVQRLRREADAIMVGGETILQDDSSLRVQDDSWPQNPQRYIWSSRQEWPQNLKAFQNDDGKKAILCKPQNSDEWENLLREMGSRNCTALLLEGGGELAASALDSGEVDRVVFFIAPKILLGRDSRPVTGGSSPLSLDNCIELSSMSQNILGKDIMINGFLSNLHLPPLKGNANI